MKTETVAGAFETYRRDVLPREAHDTQVLECRRAFYAGAYFLLMNVAHNIGDPDMPEDQGVEELEKLKAECEAFGAGGGFPLTVPVPADSNHTWQAPDAGEMRELLNELGGVLGSAVPEGWGFNLMLFQFGQGGGLLYIANAERADVLAMMREFIQKQTQ